MYLKVMGFSLMELMLTVLVAGIILSMGLPLLANTGARARQHSEVNALFHGVHLARKEAIRRREVVSICPSLDGLTCRPGRDWSAGWILFQNTDRDTPPVRDTAEPLILSHSGNHGLIVSSNRHGFNSRGIRRRATNGTIVVCDHADRIPPRALVISYTGRPRITDRTVRGEPYACAE
jgi:type IV fimbrial biogenesis protein FimT